MAVAKPDGSKLLPDEELNTFNPNPPAAAVPSEDSELCWTITHRRPPTAARFSLPGPTALKTHKHLGSKWPVHHTVTAEVILDSWWACRCACVCMCVCVCVCVCMCVCVWIRTSLRPLLPRPCWHGDVRTRGKFWNLSLLAGCSWVGPVLALPPAVSLQTWWTPAPAGGQHQRSAQSGHTQATYAHIYTTHLHKHSHKHTNIFCSRPAATRWNVTSDTYVRLTVYTLTVIFCGCLLNFVKTQTMLLAGCEGISCSACVALVCAVWRHGFSCDDVLFL